MHKLWRFHTAIDVALWCKRSHFNHNSCRGDILTVQSPQVSVIRRLLVQQANRVAIRGAEEAKGKCFLTSAKFAIAFSEFVDLRLIRWEVVDDADYREHWCIGISDTEVLDLTRVQVDGTDGVLHHVNNYPANYIQMRQYPASRILSKCRHSPDCVRDGVLNISPMGMRLAMLRYDLANAGNASKYSILGNGIHELCRLICWMLLSKIVDRLETRQRLLCERLEKYQL